MGQGKSMRDPAATDMIPDMSVFNTIGGSSTKASGPLLSTAR
jgi:hypothetical protein